MALAQSACETEIASVPGNRWEAFDLLRALAAVCVFVFHYLFVVPPGTEQDLWTTGLGWLAGKLGSLGTNLLLLISGVFVAKSVSQEGFRYWRFLGRRVVRIYPPYILVICCSTAISFIFHRPPKLDPSLPLWRAFLEQLLLWPGLYPSRPVLVVAWTLSWIMAAYVLLPWPLLVLRKHLRAAHLRVMVLSCAAIVLVTFASVSGQLSPRVAYILGGCAVWELFALSPDGRAYRANLRWLLSSAAVAITARFAVDSSGAWAFPPAKTALFTIFGLSGVALLTVAAFVIQSHYRLNYHGFPLKWVRGLGKAGYSFYILHLAAIRLFVILVFPLAVSPGAHAVTYWVLMPACLLFATATSGFSYLIVERPLQKLAVARFR